MENLTPKHKYRFRVKAVRRSIASDPVENGKDITMKPSWNMRMIRASERIGLPAPLIAVLNYLGVKGVIISVISAIVVGFSAGIGIGCNLEPPRFCPPALLPPAPTPESE